MEDFKESILLALYQYRKDIGWLNSVEPSDKVKTAEVDKNKNVKIGTLFFEKYLHSPEDIAFVLAHESSHQYIQTLLAADFEINLRYSLLCNRGWDSNYLQDILINQSLFHCIPSNLPERFYCHSKWTHWFLQRKLDPFEKIEEQITLNSHQKDLLALYRMACVDWYKSNNLIHFFEVFKKVGDFLLTFPPQQTEDLMVSHEEGKADKEMDEDKEVCEDTKDELHLRIPLVEDPITNSLRIEELRTTLTNLAENIEQKARKLEDTYSEKRQEGYGNPHIEELIEWDLGIFQPWTEPKGNPESKEILVIFDVSGSMFKYLSLLNVIRSLLKNHDATYWAFSDTPSEIIFKETYAEVKTGFGTKLDAVLEILKDREPSVVFLISDADWALGKKYPVENAENILHQHDITLFQRGSGKIAYVSRELFEVIHI